MLSAEPPHHIHVAFDDHHLVADADLTGPTAAHRCIRAKPESTDGGRECWANWDEGACKGESLGSIGTDVTPRGFSVAAPDLESGLWRLGIA